MSVPTRPGAPRPAARGSRTRASAPSGATATLTGARATPRSGERQIRRRQGEAAAAVETAPTPRRPSQVASLSWRAIVLTVVVVLALAVLMPSLRAYMRQQDDLAELRTQAEAERAEVADLQAELARWDDPAYVIAQARERLGFVMPGETPYRVIDPEFVDPDAATLAQDAARAGDPAGAAATASGEPWFETLWATFEAAGGGTSTETAAGEPDGSATETGE